MYPANLPPSNCQAAETHDETFPKRERERARESRRKKEKDKPEDGRRLHPKQFIPGLAGPGTTPPCESKENSLFPVEELINRHQN
jgi:hypothetical protein